MEETETQDKLKIGIGTKETVSLKPAKVKIVKIDIVDVKPENPKISDKVSLEVKHPDREEPIHLSSVKYLKGDKITEAGLWFSIDDDGLIRKGSTLAIFLEKMGVATLNDLKDKEAETVEAKSGFLCFKAY